MHEDHREPPSNGQLWRGNLDAAKFRIALHCMLSGAQRRSGLNRPHADEWESIPCRVSIRWPVEAEVCPIWSRKWLSYVVT
jgi:hypothetical protein